MRDDDQPEDSTWTNGQMVEQATEDGENDYFHTDRDHYYSDSDEEDHFGRPFTSRLLRYQGQRPALTPQHKQAQNEA